MLELLMPTTGGIDCVLRLEDGLFNFATYAVVKRAFCECCLLSYFFAYIASVYIYLLSLLMYNIIYCHI